MLEAKSHQPPPTFVVTTDDTTESPGIETVAAVTLPCFWNENPPLSFAQIEAKFSFTNKITDKKVLASSGISSTPSCHGANEHYYHASHSDLLLGVRVRPSKAFGSVRA